MARAATSCGTITPWTISTAGSGQDRLRGGFAHGTIYASGGEGDTIDCGKGKGDFAIVDPLDTTVLRENVRLQTLPT